MDEPTLVERLRWAHPFVNDPVSLKPRLRNPDGPEAAARITELEAALAELLRVGDDKMAFRSEWVAAVNRARALLQPPEGTNVKD